MKKIDRYELPRESSSGEVYRLVPRDVGPDYYSERTDRNIGWITREEQEVLRGASVGVAGCGGMGGQIAEKLLRLGVGELRIADNEAFDISNINRQFAAARSSIGRSKVLETARMMRAITDDTTILVYPDGVNEDVVFDFVKKCDVICDEIEFWCLGSRILLHRAAREAGIPVFVGNSLGFGSQLFLFTPTSMTMEECLGLTYEEAGALQEKVRDRTARTDELARIVAIAARTLCSEWPEYYPEHSPLKNRILTRTRLLGEGRAAVVATNIAFAGGFVADRIVLHLLRNSAAKRSIAEIPEMPGYGYLDAAIMQAKVVRGRWW